jgi:hypothetical protein
MDFWNYSVTSNFQEAKQPERLHLPITTKNNFLLNIPAQKKTGLILLTFKYCTNPSRETVP